MIRFPNVRRAGSVSARSTLDRLQSLTLRARQEGEAPVASEKATTPQHVFTLIDALGTKLRLRFEIERKALVG
jgi:hypothetical protein